MSKLLRTVIALGAAALMGLSPVAAFAETSLGVYQTTDRKMDYELSLCGGGAQLCVKLLAARGTALTKQTRPYVGKFIVNKAKPGGKNKWNGRITIQGYTLDGSLKLRPGRDFVMHGCAYVVICSDFTLIPAK